MSSPSLIIQNFFKHYSNCQSLQSFKILIKAIRSTFSIGSTAGGSESFLCVDIWDLSKKYFHRLLLISLSLLKSLSWRGCSLLLQLQIWPKSSDKQGNKSITILQINNCFFSSVLISHLCYLCNFFCFDIICQNKQNSNSCSLKS